MPRILKVVVTGPFNAGKSQFVKVISDIPVVATERKISARAKELKSQTTVALDYGRVQLGDDILHLNGTPGQPRFDFMWTILSKEMHGLVLVVDATTPDSFDNARAMLAEILAPRIVPYLIAANKQDQADALHPDQVRRRLGLTDCLVMPCVASRKTSVKMVLSQLVQMIQ